MEARRLARLAVQLGYQSGELQKLASTIGLRAARATARRAAGRAAIAVAAVYAAKPRGHMSATGRATVPDAKHPTSSPQPTSKSYKTGTARYHWKGARSAGGTSGIEPFITSRTKRAWTAEHKATRDRMGKILRDTVPGFANPFGDHAAENSHALAGSLYGPNDALSAPPASIHQNTEWLAAEEGIKKLHKDFGSSLRLKLTAYVHDKGRLSGMLKAARYKIMIRGKKVFDHVAMGNRGNIDKNEARALRAKVAGLTAASPAVSLHGTAPRGVVGAAPSLADAKHGHYASESSRLFTDLKTPAGRSLTGTAALAYAQKKHK